MSDLNRAWWEERLPIHLGSELYDLESFRSGRDSIRPFEDEELGSVEGRTLAHLQCHVGLDSLGWARRGARVTGLDFSQPAVETANGLAAELGLDAEFVCADVYDAFGALGERRFDIVYTGLGAINWLPDIGRWAQTATSLIEPGGVLYLVEFHPFTWSFGHDDLTLEHDYFGDSEGVSFDEGGTYADLEAQTQHNRTVEWQHTLGEIVSALIGAGLRLEFLHEHDYTLFPRWPFLEKHGFDHFRFPAAWPRLPLMFSLRASREDR